MYVGLFQVALANDIGKYVEEILVYLSYTVKIDSSGALLCVQQVCGLEYSNNFVFEYSNNLVFNCSY